MSNNHNQVTYTNAAIDQYLNWLLALSIFAFAGYFYFFMIKGYLPEPFVHDKSNTFMDFYNPLYWSSHEGIYNLWRSVYPPLNFLILDLYKILIAPDYSNQLNAFEIREFIGKEILYVLVIYAFLMALTVQKSYANLFDNRKIAVIFIIATLSAPSLFALERGNLIFISLYIFALLVWSETQISRSFWLALLVNIKPYFLIIYILEIIRKDGIKINNEFLILTPLISTLIFISTGFLLNQEYYLILFNLLGFASNTVVSAYEILVMPTSIIAFSSINQVFINSFIPNQVFFILRVLIYILILLTIIKLSKKKVESGYLYIFAVLFLTNFSTSTGGYGAIYFIPIIPILYKYREFLLMHIIIGMMLGFWDLIPIVEIKKFDWLIYLTGNKQIVTMDLSLGALLRPIANFIALIIFYKIIRKSSNERNLQS